MVVQELIAKLGFDVDQGGLNSVDNALGNFAKKLTLAAAGIYAVKKAVEATVWAISGSIEAAAQKEDVTTQFKVMLGDLEAAKYLYQEINQYAAVSPFETAGLADNVRQMMSFGQTAKQAFEDIKMLGDVALGDQNKLNRLALVYSQTFSAKKLTGGDLLQYVNAGFNPLELLSKKTGKSMADLRKEMEKGLITSDMVRQSFVDATSAGGKFYKGAEEGSKTWNGMLSTARDNLRMLGAELGDKMLPFLKEVLQEFFKLWDSIKGSYIALADFFGIFFENAPGAATQADAIATAFVGIANAVMVVMTGLQGIWTIMEGIGTFGGMVVGVIVDAVLMLPKAVAQASRLVSNIILMIGKATGNKALIQYGAEGVQNAETFIGGGMLAQGNAQWDIGIESTQKSWEKTRRMFDLIGAKRQGTAAIEETDRIKGILTGGASKQPVTINNQTNNLTINADDPIKTMGEAAAGRFFQSAFIQLRHATV